jgi:hypothetical protein
VENFISSANGMQMTDEGNLVSASPETNEVYSGSYVVLSCISGYMNSGGSLNITCLGNGSWTQFPNCVLSTGSGSMMTTTVSTGNGSPCMIDQATTFNISNGYYSSSSLAYTSNTTASGNHIKSAVLDLTI